MATQNKNFRVKNGIDAEGTITSTALAITGGTASQFLKANGTTDSSTYLTTGTASSTYAPIASPSLTGTPLSTTAASSVSSTQIATTAYVKSLFSSISVSGTLDWNDVSNTRPGVGPTLLLGNATNGPGGTNYYHPFTIQYAGTDGTSNVTQLAIAYGSPANAIWMRGRYSGTWSSWVQVAMAGANSTITSLTGLTTALSATQGGTAQATYTTGDILYASATNTLSKLAAGTSGHVLTSNGAATAPSWQAGTGGGVSTSGGSTITVASGTTIPLVIQNNGTGNSFVVNDVASDTTPFVIDAAGLVGMGNSTPLTQLDIIGAQVLNRGVLQVIDTTALAAGNGAGITLGGVWNSGGSTTTGVQIKASKTNATSADYSYDMVFLNYLNGDVNMTEKMRITNTGNVGIGTSSPASTLVVSKTSAGGRGGELSIINPAGSTLNNSAALNFGLESSSYNVDDGNAQIKAIITNAGTSATDMVFSLWSGAAFAERMRIASDGTTTLTGQIQSTRANSTADAGGQLYLNGATGNRIDFNQNGVAAPAFTTRSAGTKLVLFPSISGSSTDYAFGIESNTLWSSVPSTVQQFKWYAGTTQVASLSGAGLFTAVSKSFDIEHPTKPDMRLRYGSLEGPENGVYIRGKSKNKTITLPDYWTGLVHEDTITASLTSIGSGTIYVEEIIDNTVKVGGTSKEFFFTIYGERKDIDKITVEY